MPSNQIDVNVTIDTPQSDFETLKKLTEALKSLPGAQGGGGGRIQQTFATAGEGMTYLNQEAAAAKSVGSKLSGAKIRATEGGFEASGDVSGGNGEQKKAFSPGGAIAAMATGVGVAVGFFKQILGMSKIFQTFMGTTGKILATAVDLMLAPMMPFFMRIMVWLIQTIFPLATKAGKFFGALGDVGTGAALVGGFVALKLGPTLLSKAGESLGKAFVEKMGVKTIGEGISKAFGMAVDTLKDWGSSVGGFIKDGLIAVKDTLKDAFKAVGGFIKDGLIEAKDMLKDAMKAVGGFISDGLSAAAKAAKTAWEAVGGFISAGLGAAAKAAKTAWETVGGFISAGLGAAAKAAKTAWEAVGGFISTGLSTAAKAAKTAWEAVGGFISTGLSTAAKAAKTAWEAVGGFISTGLSTAAKAAKTAWESIGGFISTGLGAAAKAAKTAWEAIGSFISTGLDVAAKAAKTAWEAIGGFISTGLDVAAKGAKTAWKAVGGFISSGASVAATAAKDSWKAIGGFISAGATLAMEGAKTVWTTVGGLIGKGVSLASDAFKGAGKLIGDAIGGAMKGAKSLWSGLGSVGGLIGVGIGAAAIGATIGFMIWKEYDKFQKGKDITKDLTQLEQVRMLSQEYGVSEQQAVLIQEGMAAGGVSTSRQGMQDFMDTSKDLADQIRLFGTYNSETLATMERQEQLLFADMMEKGMMGDSKHFAPMAEMIRGGKRDGVSIGSAQETLANAELLTQQERRKAAEAEIEAQAWYAMSAGGVHLNLLDILESPLTAAVSAISSLFGKGGKGGAAARHMGEDEKRVRKALGQLYGGGSFEGEMTAEQANIGAWLTAYQGDAASSFFSAEVSKSMLGGKYQDEEIKRMAGSVINIMLNTESLEFLSDEQRKLLLTLLPEALESGVVSP